MGTLSLVLYNQGDPRWAELPAQAVLLLEPSSRGPELVGALTELARAEVLTGKPKEALLHGEQALALSEGLSLRRPARALGYFGLARFFLGDSIGLDDMREAIAIAIEAGQGREAAVIYGNLGESTLVFEGAAAALEVLETGIAFAEARGLNDDVDYLIAAKLESLVSSGNFDESIAVAAGFTEHREGASVQSLIFARAAQIRVMTLRGQTAEAIGVLDWLEAATREAEMPELTVVGLGSAAAARAAVGQHERAAALLAEIEATPGVREVFYYGLHLPSLARTAVSIGDGEQAARLVAGVEPRHPHTDHAMTTVRAALAEAQGDDKTAADAYADGAARWREFGVLTEQAFALLGQGRCLTALGQPAEAAPALQAARAIFSTLQAAPALAETDTLLQQVEQLSA
jgi:tetratricopeptide (TPR) repeat protein